MYVLINEFIFILQISPPPELKELLQHSINRVAEARKSLMGKHLE